MPARSLPRLKRQQLTFNRSIGRAAMPHVANKRSDVSILNLDSFTARTVLSIKNAARAKSELALIIPAYNEEKVIEHTIATAIKAGLSARDIYVVDDSSFDATGRLSTNMLGQYNVLKVDRSGKGLAIHKAVNTLALTKRYDWVHIADADGVFDEHYFAELSSHLDKNNAAATGYVTSLPGSIIGKYRAFEYALGMTFIRRFQDIAGVISIIPGPTSVFRADVFDKLNFNDNSLCEDFDVTMQIHRQGLGKIQFIEEAVAKTQDPANMHDFVKQITRWNRGVIQQLFKHRVGMHFSKIDFYLLYQVAQNFIFALMYLVWVPLLTIMHGNPVYLAIAFLADVIMTYSFAIWMAKQTKRPDILSAFPVVYALRWVCLLVFIKAFIEVGVLKKYRHTQGIWETQQRRSNNLAT